MRKLTEKQMENFSKQYDKDMKLPINQFAQAFAEMLGKVVTIALSQEEKKPSFVKWNGKIFPYESILNRTMQETDEIIYLDNEKNEMDWKPKRAGVR